MRSSAIRFVLTSLLIISSAAIARAEEFTYPSKNPVVSITFPDSWTVEPDGEKLHTGPKDGSMYFGFIPLAKGTTADEAGELAANFAKELVDEVGDVEQSSKTVNGITLFIGDTSGKAKDSHEPVNISFAYFTPDDNPDHMIAILYFGSDAAEKKHGKEVEKVLNSIKNPQNSEEE